MLKRIASEAATNGPILFLKPDRLVGTDWLTFATALGVRHRVIADLLAEIGSAGTPILFIDGIDRIKPNQKGIIIDILRAIEANESLSNWKVLVSSRNQGLEAYRTWFPAAFYGDTGIGDVSIEPFSNDEAEALTKEKPSLRKLLFGPVAEIARRPFFAAVLAQSFPDGTTAPQTEVGLIDAWWTRAGHDAPEEAVPQRQRALLDLAEKGVRNLGKNIAARDLEGLTVTQIAALKGDHVIRDDDGGASYSFTHDIFFEWVFFRLLIEHGADWQRCLTEAGEPPLLGRVVGLLAQHALVSPGEWTEGYRDLATPITSPAVAPRMVDGPTIHTGFRPEAAGIPRVPERERLRALREATRLVPGPAHRSKSPHPATRQELGRGSRPYSRSGPAWLAFRFSGLGPPARLAVAARAELASPSATKRPRIVRRVAECLAEIKNSRSSNILDLCSSWLIDLEGSESPEELFSEQRRWGELGGKARSNLATSLRIIILQSAQAYPEPAVALFERAIANDRMRGEVYSDLIRFTHTMADIAPDQVGALAKAELMEELPQDRIDRVRREERTRFAQLERIRAIPEQARTDAQRRALKPEFSPISLLGRDHVERDDIGINRYHQFYYPTSARHEPFAGLFAKNPEAALGLVRDLANQATQGWRQVHAINRNRMGTPIPVVIEFPWDTQTFWGDWHVYSWFMGELAPHPLTCVFLALSHWAFKQIESGRPTDEIIRAIVEGMSATPFLGSLLCWRWRRSTCRKRRCRSSPASVSGITTYLGSPKSRPEISTCLALDS